MKYIYLSIDAAMSVWIKGYHTYRRPVKPNEVMHSFGVGIVVQSKSELFKENDLVIGELGW